jgi:nitroimidazol reductase NimA-like FMN-containing flavoprotein (pyridoxamine 5'-phosphate oxidase superfamily)
MDDAIRKKILALLDQHRIMTIATLRPDGWPQATTVGYVSEGLTLYFLCGLDSQKAKNLARDSRVSLTIDHDTADLMAITGLSMAGHAHAVTDRPEAEKVLRMLPLKYPDAPPLPMKMPSPDEIRLSHKADGYFGIGLFQGLRTYRSHHLLIASLARGIDQIHTMS